MRRSRIALVFIAVVAVLGLTGCSEDNSASDRSFEQLAAGQRVYDQTGYSLDASQTAVLQQELDTLLRGTGADVIVYVRELDADPEDTFDQVEALQQAWVAATGVDQDIAGAILINREPGNVEEARAGIFVGSTYDDGNVPSDEQEAIVEDALIPPLRDGDVAGSLTAGIDRLAESIENGPPTSALNEFAAGPGSTWLPWSGFLVGLGGLLAVAGVSRGRARPTVSKQPPTTYRPDYTTDSAVATALVHRGAQASAVPATVLALAADDALTIEQEKKPGKFDEGTAQIRLRDETRVRGEIQRSVWAMLTERADGDIVDSASLKKMCSSAGDTKDLIEQHLDSNGWLANGTARPRGVLAALAVLGALMALGGIVVLIGGAVLMLVAVIPAVLLLTAGIVASVAYSRFSVAGLDAARPWEGYRDGLKQAAKSEDATIDLDAALPDIVALGLIPDFGKRLDAATDPESGTTLRAFAAPGGAVPHVFLPWAAFAGSSSTAGTSGGTVSGGGAGGGGGAAGST